MEVARVGAVPVLVHTMYEHYQHLHESFWTEACRSILSTCHALAVDVPFDQLELSAGTVDEVGWAVEDKKPIFFDDDPLAPWRAGPGGLVVRTVRGSLSSTAQAGLASWVAGWTAERARAVEEDARDRRIAAEVSDTLERRRVR